MALKRVFVLGSGGAVGVAYHCGALRALRELGLDARDADLLIGTSSGAIVAAELALGRTVDELAAEMHPEARGEEPVDRLAPAWRSRTDLARRAVGSSWVLVRTAMPRAWPTPQPPRWMQRALPGSLYAVGAGDWGPSRYPDDWPAQEVWLVAADLDRGGRRVVLDRERAPLGTAVMASCAVPGVLPPVRVGRRRMIDGGLRSPTNLDLARRVEADLVIALAPMGYEPHPAPSRLQAVGRRRFNARLEKESATIRGTGTPLLVLRPDADQLRQHGSNILARRNSAAVMSAAYEATLARRSEITELLEEAQGRRSA